MKKICVFVCLLAMSVIAASAQNTRSFFNDLGMAQLTTEEFAPSGDTIVKVYHRLDDIVWARTVYRIIDMRYKQNYPLYFPVRSDDPRSRSLFRVVVDAVVDGLPIYEKNADYLTPDFTDETLIKRAGVPYMFLQDPNGNYDDDDTRMDIQQSSAMLINYDSVADEMTFNPYSYEDFVRNQTKYIIEEVVFFDKHTSRLHSKIMSIAPMYADKIASKDDVSAALRESIMFWIPFDLLRPYMAKHYIIPTNNDTKRVTFDEFFQKRLYSSYLVGESNVYNRYLPDFATTPEDIKREQNRIEAELLNFEQDLWEY